MGLGVRGFLRSGIAAGLLSWLLAAAQAAPLAEQIVADGPHQVIIRRTSEGSQVLLVRRAGFTRRAILTEQSLTAVPFAPIGGRRTLLVRGWSGGAYCCFTLHLMRQTATGWAVIGTFDVGKNEAARPRREGRVLWVPEGGLDFWDLETGRATDLRVPLAYSLLHGRMSLDDDAMRRPVAEALGQECLTRGGANPGPPNFSTLEGAAAGLAAGEWSQDPRSRRSWRPEAEFARRALCLFYTGHGEAAQRLLAAWPADRPGRDAAERQIIARLACTGTSSGLIRLNGADHPWLRARCGAVREDRNAVHAQTEALQPAR